MCTEIKITNQCVGYRVLNWANRIIYVAMGVFFSCRPQLSQSIESEFVISVRVNIKILTTSSLATFLLSSLYTWPFLSLCDIDIHEPNLDISLFQSIEVESLYGSWANITVDDPLAHLNLRPGRLCRCMKLCSEFFVAVQLLWLGG